MQYSKLYQVKIEWQKPDETPNPLADYPRYIAAPNFPTAMRMLNNDVSFGTPGVSVKLIWLGEVMLDDEAKPAMEMAPR